MTSGFYPVRKTPQAASALAKGAVVVGLGIFAVFQYSKSLIGFSTVYG